MEDCRYEALENFQVAVKEVLKRNQELHKLQSEADLMQQDLLHYIEFQKIDAVTAMKLFKKLRQIRETRRKIKDEIGAYTSLISRLKMGNLIKYSVPKEPERTCRYTIDEILAMDHTFGGEFA
jgi:hypothetical protein